jgi:hypothetical protein
MFTEMTSIFTTLNSSTEAVRTDVENRLWVILLEFDLIAAGRVPRVFDDYVQNSALLGEDYGQFSKLLPPDKYPPLRLPQLLYGHLTREFSFDHFRRLRPDLETYDEIYAGFFSEPDALLNTQFAPPSERPPPGTFKKAVWLYDQRVKMSQNGELLEVLRTACLESSPLRKMEQFQFALMRAKQFFAEEAPPSNPLGADEFMPIMVSYAIAANPPYFISNFVYRALFAGRTGYGGLFKDRSVEITAVFRVLISLAPQHVKDALMDVLPKDSGSDDAPM